MWSQYVGRERMVRMTTRAEHLFEALRELVAIKSVSPDATCAGDVLDAARWVAKRMRRIGGEVTILEGCGGFPLVIGEVRASSSPAEAPDVLLYAHVDVQGAGPLESWDSPPFELTARNGQLYGRGVADDKANVVILLAAVEKLADARTLPVNVRFLIDAEEEIGGDSADKWLLSDTRGASVAVMLDGSVDELTIGIRGMVYGRIRVATGVAGQHSGLYGGAALSASEALVRAVSALLPGEDGRLPPSLRVDAVSTSEAERESWQGLPPGHELLAEAGLRAADATAARNFHERTRAQPALTITGVHSGDVSQFSSSIPVDAEANIMLRPVAGQSATALAAEVERLLRQACPPEAALELNWDLLYDGAAIQADAPELAIAADAVERHLGARPIPLRTGGSLPLFENLCLRGIPVICTGFGIERVANMHGPNERFPESHLQHGADAMCEILTLLGEHL
jgi:acetylornithine deacetylase/succinyl-diaminopimelate desuccinylase-like protein